MKKRFVALVLSAVLPMLPLVAAAEADGVEQAKATRVGVDVTGMWFNAAESGWGLNLIQQENVLFATLFIYDTDRTPVWLVGSSLTGSVSGSDIVFTGTHYLTSGPPYNGAFNPSAVTATPAGTMTIRFLGSSNYHAATLAYTVNGVTYTKNITPFAFAANNLTGTYVGGSFGATAACGAPVLTGTTTMTWTITHTGNTATIVNAATGCTMTGTVTQYGKQLSVYGNYTCTGGRTGQFGFDNIESGAWGLTGLYASVSDSACAGKLATIGMARSQ